MTCTADEATAALDLNDIARDDGFLFVRDGVGLAGRGVAARVPTSDAAALLASIEHEDRTGGAATLPVAIGWVPFDPGAAGEVVVPAVTLRKTADGRRLLTVVDGASEQLASSADPVPAAAAYAIEPVTPVERYLAAVAAVRDAVRAGALTKAVIAREIAVTSDRPIDRHGVLHRLKASFGSSYRYAIDGLIGASPELLVEVDGNEVRAHPLAGTAPRTGDVDRDAEIAAALVASTKNQVEHRVVIDVVHDTLLPWCSFLDWEPDPSIVTVANVQHLGTRIEGMLSSPPPNVLELVAALSPTPAVGGHPRAAALALIADVEGVDRGRYAGAVGWVDAAGNGTWAVTLRCAELSADGRRARLTAGGGIVADSDPLDELAETQAKFQAMLSALIRP
ncbi:MAG TPA: isochorismate synthase [Ilumatobacteraceae bacterium]|nr:isochorismate synthase [Ilumatobacteraceae bacterium]